MCPGAYFLVHLHHRRRSGPVQSNPSLLYVQEKKAIFSASKVRLLVRLISKLLTLRNGGGLKVMNTKARMHLPGSPLRLLFF